MLARILATLVWLNAKTKRIQNWWKKQYFLLLISAGVAWALAAAGFDLFKSAPPKDAQKEVADMKSAWDQLDDLKGNFSNRQQAVLMRMILERTQPPENIEVTDSYLGNLAVPSREFVSLAMRGCRFSRPNFENMTVNNFDISGSTLRYANLRKAVISGGRFENAAVVEGFLEGANLSSVSFDGSALFLILFGDLRPSTEPNRIRDGLRPAKLKERTTFRDTCMLSTRFEGVAIDDASFDGAFLWNVSFREATLHDVSFRNAVLGLGVQTDGKWRVPATWEPEKLADALPEKCAREISGVGLDNTELRHLVATHPKLSVRKEEPDNNPILYASADSRVDFSDATFSGTIDFRGADLRATIGLSQQVINDACLDADTKLPVALTFTATSLVWNKKPCRALEPR